MIDYFQIIHKYIPPDSLAYRIYLPHVSMVTAKALAAARRLGLSVDQLRFIEEAGMLHDIGIIKVDTPQIGCTGSLPYIAHLPEGRKILEAEGLPTHALVAERHSGVGISKTEIVEKNLPLPHRDLLPETIEEEIISWADLFYGKNPERLWKSRSVKKVHRNLETYYCGEEKVKQFEEWQQKFRGRKPRSLQQLD